MQPNASRDEWVERSERGQHDAHSSEGDHPGKCAYCRPILTALGDVRDLTLGPTRGSLESGNGGIYESSGVSSK